KSRYLTALKSLRNAAFAELQQSGVLKEEVNELVTDGEKLLKGGENALKRLIKRNEPDREETWLSLTAKLSKKFSKKLEAVEVHIGDWYMRTVDEEVQDVRIFILS